MKTILRCFGTVGFAGAMILGFIPSALADEGAAQETSIVAETQATTQLAADVPVASKAEVPSEPVLEAVQAAPVIEPAKVEVVAPAAPVQAEVAPAIETAKAEVVAAPVDVPAQQTVTATAVTEAPAVDQAALDAEEAAAQAESSAANAKVEADHAAFEQAAQQPAAPETSEVSVEQTDLVIETDGSQTETEVSTTSGGTEYCLQDESNRYTIHTNDPNVGPWSKGGVGPCEEPPVEDCPEGEVRDENGECVCIEEPPVVIEDCPEGQHRDYEGGPCHVDVPEDCPEGQHRDGEGGECHVDTVVVPPVEEECPEGTHRDNPGEDCHSDEVKEEDCPEVVVPPAPPAPPAPPVTNVVVINENHNNNHVQVNNEVKAVAKAEAKAVAHAAVQPVPVKEVPAQQVPTETKVQPAQQQVIKAPVKEQLAYTGAKFLGIDTEIWTKIAVAVLVLGLLLVIYTAMAKRRDRRTALASDAAPSVPFADMFVSGTDTGIAPLQQKRRFGLFGRNANSARE